MGQSCYECCNLFFIHDSRYPAYHVRCLPHKYPGPEREMPKSGQCDCGQYRGLNKESAMTTDEEQPQAPLTCEGCKVNASSQRAWFHQRCQQCRRYPHPDYFEPESTGTPEPKSREQAVLSAGLLEKGIRDLMERAWADLYEINRLKRRCAVCKFLVTETWDHPFCSANGGWKRLSPDGLCDCETFEERRES